MKRLSQPSGFTGCSGGSAATTGGQATTGAHVFTNISSTSNLQGLHPAGDHNNQHKPMLTLPNSLTVVPFSTPATVDQACRPSAVLNGHWSYALHPVDVLHLPQQHLTHVTLHMAIRDKHHQAPYSRSLQAPPTPGAPLAQGGAVRSWQQDSHLHSSKTVRRFKLKPALKLSARRHTCGCFCPYVLCPCTPCCQFTMGSRLLQPPSVGAVHEQQA